MSNAKQLRRWCFTMPKGELTHAQVIKCMEDCKYTKYAFQLEKGDEKGYEHYQGTICGPPRRLSELVGLKMFGADTKPHYSATHDAVGSKMYCMKEDSRVDGPWTDKDKPAYIPKADRGLELRLHQKWIVDRLRKQNDRQVMFVVDKEGASGKSTLGRWLTFNEGAFIIPASMKTAEDMMQLVYAKVHERPDKTYTIVMDLPRALNKAEQWGKFLSALEDIKGGHVYDKRYQYKDTRFEPPRVLVFTNAYPPKGMLTPDRVDVVDMLWAKFASGYLSKIEYDQARAVRQHNKDQLEERRKAIADGTYVTADEDTESYVEE